MPAHDIEGVTAPSPARRDAPSGRDTPVTLTPKRYVYVCAGCDLLDMSERSDKLTCSGACRVRAHRNGLLTQIKALAAAMHIHPAGILQCDAIQRLRPDLMPQLEAGTLTIEDAQPEACNAFTEVLRKQLEARP